MKHDLTQEELAQLVGASRETVNKALADFVHRGWIQLQGKSVVVLDEERLRRRATVEPEPRGRWPLRRGPEGPRAGHGQRLSAAAGRLLAAV